MLVIQDRVLWEFVQRLDGILEGLDEVIADPLHRNEAVVLHNLRLFYGDLKAEMMNRQPTPEWTALEQKVSGLVQ